jgi:hypothetical protein
MLKEEVEEERNVRMVARIDVLLRKHLYKWYAILAITLWAVVIG